MTEKQKQAVKRIMKGLKCSESEAVDIMRSDTEIDKGEEQDFDLSPEKAKIAQKFAHTGTRKAPTVYKFDKKERKPNKLKESIVQQIAQKLAELTEQPQNITIVNKNRQVNFTIGNENFDLTLVQKRQKKDAD